jgi:hypothetical protein
LDGRKEDGATLEEQRKNGGFAMPQAMSMAQTFSRFFPVVRFHLVTTNQDELPNVGYFV